MQTSSYVTYYGNKKPDSTVHETINDKPVKIGKNIFIEGFGKWNDSAMKEACKLIK